MVDKNLFLYDLAAVAIMKDEGRYLREWLDYHLLAGVEHFYLYDNDSTDNQREVVAPYVAAGLVDYIPAPGKMMQMPAYNDAVKNFRFACRYMAFIDCDEFIFPKDGRSIAEVVDQILSHDTNAAGVAINWQIFGSNGHEAADYSRGVLERFTRRAPTDWHSVKGGNETVKHISNPRKIHYIYNPHCAKYFDPLYPVNENTTPIRGPAPNATNKPVTADKIVVNHYYTKSREEFTQKISRGRCDNPTNTYNMTFFDTFDRNDEFDDGILRYRAAHADDFTIAADERRLERVQGALTKNLSLFAAGKASDLETALTLQAVSSYLRGRFPNSSYWRLCEEASLGAVLNSLEAANFSDAQLLLRVLPEILPLPYSAAKELRLVARQVIRRVMEEMSLKVMWGDWAELDCVQTWLNSEEAE